MHNNQREQMFVGKIYSIVFDLQFTQSSIGIVEIFLKVEDALFFQLKMPRGLFEEKVKRIFTSRSRSSCRRS